MPFVTPKTVAVKSPPLEPPVYENAPTVTDSPVLCARIARVKSTVTGGGRMYSIDARKVNPRVGVELSRTTMPSASSSLAAASGVLPPPKSL